MKTCTKCLQTKPLDAFYKRSRAKDSLTARCKACINSDQAEAAEAIQRSSDLLIVDGHEKSCTKCGIRKPASAFNKDRRKKDGLTYYCKLCASKITSVHCVNNPEKRRTYAREYRKSNPDRARAWQESYKLANPSKVMASKKTWKERNVSMVRSDTAKRRAARLLAQPAWADPKRISQFYAEAERLSIATGKAHHVDHIVPLLGPIAKSGPFKGHRLVYGLHCEANLQVMPGKENIAKSNRSWPDMP